MAIREYEPIGCTRESLDLAAEAAERHSRLHPIRSNEPESWVAKEYNKGLSREIYKNMIDKETDWCSSSVNDRRIT